MSGVVSPPGDHKYVPPLCDGVAVIVPDSPMHKVRSFTDTVGAEVTVTVEVSE